MAEGSGPSESKAVHTEASLRHCSEIRLWLGIGYCSCVLPQDLELYVPVGISLKGSACRQRKFMLNSEKVSNIRELNGAVSCSLSSQALDGVCIVPKPVLLCSSPHERAERLT